jgi:DNA invertase Pin-like site-specific DNA recombinase
LPDNRGSKMMEGVLAAFAQFDNDVRSDRTRAGMKAALELGRWVFLAPIGYLNTPRAMGKSLMPDLSRRRLCGEHSRSTRPGASPSNSSSSSQERGA